MAKSWVAGADGCKGGWVLALREVDSERMLVRVVGSIAEAFDGDERPEILGIDVPIGLLDRAAPGGRDCDQAARKLLGQPRARSVFSPPARAALRAKSYRGALRLNRSSSWHRVGISRQCFGILPKIREVDQLVTPPLQKRIVEVHPEVTFHELNQGALAEGKKSRAGLRKRTRLLERAWGCKLSRIVEAHRSSKVSRDDIVDAMAVCWTAERVLAGREVRLPVHPPRDSRGLRMEIVR